MLTEVIVPNLLRPDYQYESRPLFPLLAAIKTLVKMMVQFHVTVRLATHAQ